MMKALRIIFADQLSKNNPVLSDMQDDDYLMFYEPLETFKEIRHHKHKIVFLVSSLRQYASTIKHMNVIHRKINKGDNKNLNDYLKETIKSHQINRIIVAKPSDYKVYKDLMFFCQSNDIKLEVFKDKKFISSDTDFDEWASDKKTRIQEYLSLIHI